MEKKKPFIKRVPNILTVIRLCLVPLFIYAFFHPGWVLPERYFSMLIFVVASLTDLIDGYIARKYDAISNFGKLADPVADKALTISALWILAYEGLISDAFLYLVIAKELLMILGGFVLLKMNIVVFSLPFGKIAMALFVLGITMSFIPNIAPYNDYVLYIALFMTIVSLFLYAYTAIGYIREKKIKDKNVTDNKG